MIVDFSNHSERKTFLFLVLIALALTATVFMYLYTKYADTVVAAYADDITVCENILAEDDCLAKPACNGIYGPTDSISDSLEFKSCAKLTSDLKTEISADQKLCEQTDGLWHTNKLGNFCLCQQAGLDKIFDKSLGCVNR